LNSHRLHHRSATSLVIAIILLLLVGSQSLAAGTRGKLAANPAPVAFATTKIGAHQTRAVNLLNYGGTNLTITRARVSGAGFSMNNLALPLLLKPRQTTVATIAFAPVRSGNFSGSVEFLTVAADGVRNRVVLSISGFGTGTGTLTSNPSSLAFGSIQVGSKSSQPETLTNTGGAAVTISQATASGAGFSVSGLTLPITLATNQSVTFNAIFAPASAGAVSGALTIVSDAPDSPLSIPLSGTGLASGSLTANPTSLGFGSVQVGSKANLSETLTNQGASTITISQANLTGAVFSVSGLTLPLTLTANQSVAFTATFAPTSAGAASGALTVVSNASNSPLSIPLSGTGLASGSLTANPTSLGFGSVQVGSKANLSETLTNQGASTITISQANLTGAVFSVSGLTLPLTLTANQSVTFTATFAPTSAGAASGALTVVSNASNSPLNIPLSGTGIASGRLAVSPTSLSFGSVAVGSSASLTGSLNASGASVTVASASLSNGEFVVSGISLPVTLTAGQSTPFTVTFTPQASGAASASLSFSSNAANSPAVQSMTGTGAAPAQHAVDLTWHSSNNAVGYNVYRGTKSGGPYSMINPSLDSTTAYTDTAVGAGQTYYYVATTVDGNSNESGYSAETQAVIPNP
jgi:hypothetical protein